MTEAEFTAIYTRLTRAQRHLLGRISVGDDSWVKVNLKVVAKLVHLGLVEQFSCDVAGWPPVTILRYQMPMPVHRAWCEMCSTLVRMGKIREDA